MKNMMEDCEIKLPIQHVETRKLVKNFKIRDTQYQNYMWILCELKLHMQMQYFILWLYKKDIKILNISIKIRYNIYSIW